MRPYQATTRKRTQADLRNGWSDMPFWLCIAVPFPRIEFTSERLQKLAATAFHDFRKTSIAYIWLARALVVGLWNLLLWVSPFSCCLQLIYQVQLSSCGCCDSGKRKTNVRHEVLLAVIGQHRVSQDARMLRTEHSPARILWTSIRALSFCR
jgi:hypothetical protein